MVINAICDLWGCASIEILGQTYVDGNNRSRRPMLILGTVEASAWALVAVLTEQCHSFFVLGRGTYQHAIESKGCVGDLPGVPRIGTRAKI